MAIFKSNRQKEKVLGYLSLSWIILFVIASAFTAYIIFFFQNCINNQNNCDFTKFLSPYDTLFVTIIGFVVAIILYAIRYFTNQTKIIIEEFERCAELKKQLNAIKGDYVQMKNMKTLVLQFIDQKNTRIMIIHNMNDLLRHHYSKELSQDISYLCEKCIIFPFSLSESTIKKLEVECNMIISLIEDVLHQLNEKPHNKHK